MGEGSHGHHWESHEASRRIYRKKTATWKWLAFLNNCQCSEVQFKLSSARTHWSENKAHLGHFCNKLQGTDILKVCCTRKVKVGTPPQIALPPIPTTSNLKQNGFNTGFPVGKTAWSYISTYSSLKISWQNYKVTPHLSCGKHVTFMNRCHWNLDQMIKCGVPVCIQQKRNY